MAIVTGSVRASARLLNFLVWIRTQPLLQVLYRRFPQRWRDGVNRMLSARARSYLRFPKNEAWNATAAESPLQFNIPDTAEDGRWGVNIIGYIRGQLGLGESARLYARALLGAGVGVRLYDVDLDLPHGWGDRSLEAWIGDDLPYEVTIIFVNPDYLDEALEKVGRLRLDGHYVIACWFWELERVPEAWLPAIDQVDEIMAASKFIERSFRQVSDRPVFCVPQPVGEVVSSGLRRVDFGLEEGKFIFLVVFDFNSWVERKNPYAAIDAFRQAFPPERNDVRLLIKSSNGFRHPEKFHKLLNAVICDARIDVRDQIIDRVHLNALLGCADAYVSLHRAEGLGLVLAECMALGKPVIATGWSGNMDFMDEDNSCLVSFQMVSVSDGEYIGGEGALWAEADVQSAASYMRRLVDEPEFASTVGKKAAQSVSSSESFVRAGGMLSRRLRELRSSCL